MTDIWQPVELGAIELHNRFAMAPMTHSRAKPDGTPGDLALRQHYRFIHSRPLAKPMQAENDHGE